MVLNKEMENISKRLKEAIEYKGLTNYKLSKISSISEATIGRIINNPPKKPNESTLLSLARSLNVNSDWLINGVGERDIIKEEAKTEDPLIQSIAKELLEMPFFQEGIKRIIENEITKEELIEGLKKIKDKATAGQKAKM